jgi:nitroreductase
MTEPWRFVQVGPEMRRRLADIAVGLKANKGVLSEEARERARAKVLEPPELLVLVQVLASDSEVQREDYAAMACAQQNLALALWAEGVGSKWSTGGVTQASDTYSALQIDPATQRIVGFFWAGYPATEMPKARRRLGLSELLRTFA